MSTKTQHLLNECRFQLSRTAVKLTLVLAFLLSSCAVWLGTTEVQEQQATIDKLIELDKKERSHAWESHDDDWGYSAYYGFHYTYDRPHPLAFAALGQRNLLPWQHRIRMLALEGQIYEREVSNPVLAQIGQLDFAFVVAFLLPLLMIVLIHDVRASERSTNRELLLLVATGGNSLWLRRAVILTGLLGGSAIIPFWIGCLLNHVAVMDWLLASVLVITYLSLWALVIYLFARSSAKAEVSACRLLGVWFLVAVAVPVLGRLAIINSSDIPAPGDILLQQREAVNAGWDHPQPETMAKFLTIYPEWREQATIEKPFEWKWYFAFHQLGDLEVADLSKQYRDGIKQQESTAHWLGLIAPPLLFNNLMTNLSQTDYAASARYERSVRQFHQRLREFYYPLLFENPTFDRATLDKIPAYQPTTNSLKTDH